MQPCGNGVWVTNSLPTKFHSHHTTHPASERVTFSYPLLYSPLNCPAPSVLLAWIAAAPFAATPFLTCCVKDLEISKGNNCAAAGVLSTLGCNTNPQASCPFAPPCLCRRFTSCSNSEEVRATFCP
eukprot:TRINITY_DN67687_c11_g4_i1.p1 TRINITY_DN67687_c11_g4~~TRINITY_DN67687_c11_g4_i1.p1  ORF type:complete len:126 (+),score=3.56 TRINITY_DN67687_c11_g4_i1:199-576(+)